MDLLLHSIQEEEIRQGCSKGKVTYQEALYKKYAPMFYSLSLRYVKDEMDAEDMVSNGFIKIFSRIKQYRNEGSFEGWMRRIMVNECIDFLRNKKKENTMSIVEVENTAEPDWDKWDSKLDGDTVLKLIQELPQGYATVFNLYVIDGFSHAEIATTLNISEGASKSQLSRARAQLKRKILSMEISANKINSI